jgi:DNA polymerase-3 subunit delta
VRAFAPSERFVAEVKQRTLRPAYVFIGDEAFFRKRCREAILQYLVPPDLRDFSLHEVDLSETSIGEILDRARTPSLLASFQVFFIGGVKLLYGRGSHEDEFAAIEKYVLNPNPDALLVFVADHISIPADVRRMEMQDRDRYQRLRDTLGEFCGIVELARVEEGEAVRWVKETTSSQGVEIEVDAAREIVDALAGDMMLLAVELEKLVLYVAERKKITLIDVETMVLAAKHRSLYDLTDAISARDRSRALNVLNSILSTAEGEEAAIGHLYMLAKTFRQMLVIFEKRARDQRALWQVLWQGFRVPPFAAEDILRQAGRYKSKRELVHALQLIARADLELRSNPPSKRLVLESLVLELSSGRKAVPSAWAQQELLV